MFYAHISDDKRKQTFREHLDNVAELRLMIINAKLIGKRIKEVRTARKMPQMMLAEKCDIISIFIYFFYCSVGIIIGRFGFLSVRVVFKFPPIVYFSVLIIGSRFYDITKPISH